MRIIPYYHLLFVSQCVTINERSDIMSTITIRLNDNEEKIFNEYARLYGKPLSTLFKKILEEKIEDEFDMKIINEYEDNVKNNSTELFDHSEVKKMLGL